MLEELVVLLRLLILMEMVGKKYLFQIMTKEKFLFTNFKNKISFKSGKQFYLTIFDQSRIFVFILKRGQKRKMNQEKIPKTSFFQSIVHFGTDFVKETPLISLNIKEFNQLDEKDESVVPSSNLAQDREYSKEVYKVLNSKDSKLAKTVKDLIESTDVSFL
jgi:hypothetical protein